MKISIITVTFNRAHVIRDSIEGVLKQKYKDYEYIIVDGASKDNTVEILKEYEPKFEGRMRWISEPDSGLYDAMNKGIKMATGDVVGIINSDDYFHRDDVFDIISKAFIDDCNIDCIFGNARIVNADNLEHNYRYSAPWFFRPWMFRIGYEPFHPTFYAKKELFEKWGYYKMGYIISADFELMMRFMLVNKARYKYVNHTFLTFRNTGISTDRSNRHMMNKEIVRACDQNNIWTSIYLVYLKYFIRITELIGNKNRK